MLDDAEIRVRIDIKTKDKAVKLFKRYGLPLGIGVKLLIQHAVQTKRVPYHPHVPNAKTQKALEECLGGKGTPITLDELSKMITNSPRKTSKKRGEKNAK